MALYRVVCAFGHHSLVTILTQCGLPLPVYLLADEQHSRCLADKVYLPTIVRGRVILMAIPSPMRKGLHSQFHTLLYRARQRKSLWVFAFGQWLRCFVDHVTTIAGAANGQRVRRWSQEKKTGWSAVLAAPWMPVTSTLLDQAYNAIERKLFMMKAEAVHDEGLPSSPRKPVGVSVRARSSVHPRALPTAHAACWPMWGGSRRRVSPNTGLVPQPANPHVKRLSMSGDTAYR